MREQIFVSPKNVVITFAEAEVGHLQSLTISERYNLQPIKHLWQSTVVGFVPGISEFSATASKAYIEYSSFLGTVQDIVNTINTMKNANTTWESVTGVNIADKIYSSISSGISSSVDWLAQGKLKINSPIQIPSSVLTLFDNILNGVASLGEIFSSVAFDIKVKNPAIQSNLFASGSTLGMPDLWVLRGCQIDSRNINISAGNVVILEDITIKAKNNYDSGISTAVNGYVPLI